MTWWDFQGHQHEGSPPSYDDTNGQDVDNYGPEDDDDDVPDATWRTRDGKEIPIGKLEDSHLLNIQRAIKHGTAPARSIWINMFIDGEVVHRGLTPLEPFSCTEEASATASVSILYMQWPRHGVVNTEALNAFEHAFINGEILDEVPFHESIGKPIQHILAMRPSLSEKAQKNVLFAVQRWRRRCVGA